MLVTEGRSQVTRIATDPVTMAYHELRSPLALVATVARSAAEECEDELVRARCLSIVRAAERMIRTAGHLMDLAETSQAEKVEQFNPLPCIDRVATDYMHLGAPVVVRVNGRAECLIEAVPEQFEALLCSIMGNAIDHGDPDQPIVIEASCEERSFHLAVTNPIGIAQGHRGIGLGRYIGDQLAQGMSAVLHSERTEDGYRAVVSIPRADRVLVLAG